MAAKPEKEQVGKPQPKVLVGVGGGARLPGESSPFGTFKTLLRDFSSGIRALQRISVARAGDAPGASAARAPQEGLPATSALQRENSPATTHSQSRLIERLPFLMQGPSNTITRETRVFQSGSKSERDSKQTLSQSLTDRHSATSTSSSKVQATTSQSSTSKSTTAKDAKELRTIDKHSTTTTAASASQQTKLLLERLRAQMPTLSSLGVATAKLPPALQERARSAAVVSGADQEAFKQFQQPYKEDDPSHVPAPARLAQILHADAAVRRGEGRPVPALHALADAIRDGRRRDVADLDPGQVKRIVESALGGQTRAGQVLNTPLIKQLVERNVNTVKVLQRSRQAASNSTVLSATATPGRAAVLTGDNSFKPSAQRGESFTGRAPEKQTAESHEPELVGMAGGNDDVHLHAAAARAKDSDNRESVTHYRNMDRVIGDGGSASASGTSSATLNLGGTSESSGPAIGRIRGHGSVPSSVAANAQGKQSILPFDLQTPKGGQAQKAISQLNADKGSDKRKELTGKLKMIGVNGQPLGEAHLEGEM